MRSFAVAAWLLAGAAFGVAHGQQSLPVAGVTAPAGVGEAHVSSAGEPDSPKTKTQDQARRAPTQKIAEEPSVYYVRDKEGRLVPLLGFSYEEISEFLKQKKFRGNGTGTSAGFSIEQLSIKGDVQGNLAELTADYKIELQTADSVSVPLIGNGPVLREAATFLGNADHSLDYDSRSGHYIARLRGAAGSEVQITLKLAVPLKAVAGETCLEMDLPSAAASQLMLRVPQSAVELTQHSGASIANIKPTSDQAACDIACLGLDGPVSLAWQARGENAELPLFPLDVTGQILARIDGRHVQFDCRLTVSSLAAPLQKFRINLPPETELSASSPQSTGYTLTTLGKRGSRSVEVQLAARTVGPVEIHLQAERPYDVMKPDPTLELAGFSVGEALPHRQSGQLAVAVEGDWQVSWVQQNRIRQIEEVAEPLRDKSVVAGFEYFGQPASLQVRVAPRKTRVIVEPEYQCFVDAHQARLQATLKYSVRGAKTSALEIAMPGWEIDEVRPAGLVDADAIPAAGGLVSAIQLLQPTIGEFELTLKAHRELPTNAGRIDLPLPMPTADVVGPAILAILPADNVRVRPRDGESQSLTRITVPPRMRLPAQQQPALFYRAEQLPAVLVADMERIPQSVSASVESNMDLHRDGLRIEQRFRYKVEHGSLNSITLDVPATVLSDADLQFEFEGQTLPPVEASAADPELSIVAVDIPLPSPQLGVFELVARYRVPQNTSLGEAGSHITAPLLMPAGALLTSNNVTVIGELATRIQPYDELWTLVDDPQESVGGKPNVRLAATQSTSDVSLAFTQGDSRGQGTTVVQRAWVQTWVSGGVRQDRATYRFIALVDELEIELPQGVLASALAVRLDQQPISSAAIHNGTISINLPLVGRNQPHVLELRYQLAHAAPVSGPLEFNLPRLSGDVWVQRMYWQLVLPRDEHLISTPPELTPEFKWAWSGLTWSPQPSWDQADLETWVGATGDVAVPEATNQYLFSAADKITRIDVRAAARWQIVLVASAIVLAIGLMLIYVPVLRKPGLLFALGVVVLALAAWLPDAAVLFSQAAVVGICLAIVGSLLHGAMGRRRARGVIVSGKSSSVIERSKHPSKIRTLELVGAASTMSIPAQMDEAASEPSGE